jgi:hypothetical protein
MQRFPVWYKNKFIVEVMGAAFVEVRIRYCPHLNLVLFFISFFYTISDHLVVALNFFQRIFLLTVMYIFTNIEMFLIFTFSPCMI